MRKAYNYFDCWLYYKRGEYCMEKKTALSVAERIIARNQALANEDKSVEPMTNLKLQKLLYFIQGTMLSYMGEPLFDDDFVAWDFGPVVAKVYHEYKKFKERAIKQNDVKANVNEDKKEEVLFNIIFDEYNKYSAMELSNMTHKEGPYVNAKKNEVIQKKMIQDFFTMNMSKELKRKLDYYSDLIDGLEEIEQGEYIQYNSIEELKAAMNAI